MRLTSALLFSACACVAADLPANLKKDIDAGNQAWVDGLKAGDANRIVSSYSQDSVNCNAAGDCVKGPMAVCAIQRGNCQVRTCNQRLCTQRDITRRSRPRL